MKTKTDKTPPNHTEINLCTEDGYPSPELIMKAYKVWDKEFGKIEIVSTSPSISDIVRELEASKSKLPDEIL